MARQDRDGGAKGIPEDLQRDRLGIGLLVAFVALSFLGRFLPGPATWGFHLHAYLPGAFAAIWLGLAVLLFLPPSQRAIGRAMAGWGPRWLFSPFGPVVFALACVVPFVVLSERSYFMGDGYLVGELIERGMPFRSFDNMDYLLHFQIYKSLRNPLDPTAITSFEIYRWGAVAAGGLGAIVLTILSSRLAWEPWQKFLLVALFFLSAPAAMFYGYVESYAFLLVFVSAFLLSGVLVLEGRLPLWVASLFYGLAAFMHLTAAFDAAGLLFLALFAPVRPIWRRWMQALGPAVVVFGVSVVAHIGTGYDTDFFRREFLEAQNTKNLWVAWTGPHGFLSLEHWRDLLNLAVLGLPVPIALLLARLGRIRGGLRARTLAFLLTHAAFVGIFLLFIDRKLGGARDWDLFAAHGFGLTILAVWALGASSDPESARSARPSSPSTRASARASAPPLARAALPAAFLLFVPWVVLLNAEARSIERFVDVAAGFPRFARAYAYEEVGKYYRKADDIDQALRMYELCVETYPSNGRFHVLLGSMYIRKHHDTAGAEEKKAFLDKAVASYREGVRLQEGDPRAISLLNLGRALILQGNWEEAIECHSQVARLEPGNAENWANLAYASLQAGRLEEAIGAYGQALALNRTLEVRQQLGAAYLATGRFDEAARTFRAATETREDGRIVRYGLAAALVAMADRAVQAGSVPDLAWIVEADEILRTLLSGDPNDAEARTLYQRLVQVRSSTP